MPARCSTMHRRFKRYGSASKLRFAVLILTIIVVVPWADEAFAQESTKPPTPLPPGALFRLGVESNGYRSDGIQGIAISPDSRLIATRSVAHICRVYDAVSGKKLYEFEPFTESRLTAILFSHDGRELLTLTNSEGEGRPLISWDMRTGKPSANFEFAGDRLFRARDEQNLILFRGIQHVTFDPQKPTKAKVSYLKTNRNSATVMALNRIQSSLLLYVRPPGSRINNHRLTIHSMDGGSDRDVLFTSRIIGVSASPRTDHFAVACKSDARVHIQSTSDRREVYQLQGHSDAVHAIEFTPDGRFMVSVSEDEKARIWDFAAMETILTVDGHGDRLVSLAVSPDGKYFVTGSSGKRENCAMVWDLRQLVFPRRENLPETPDFEKSWKALTNANASIVFEGMNDFYHRPKQATEWFKAKLVSPIQRLTPEEIQVLIEQLDDPRYAKRSEAYIKLNAIRRMVTPLLKARLQESASVELRFQIRRLLSVDSTVTPSLTREVRRTLRALHLLELFGGAASKEVVIQLAENHTNQQVVAEARFVLSRMQ